MNVKERSVLFKKCSVLFSIYIYICMSIYIYIYIEKRTECFRVLLQMNETFSRSFPFFAKEHCVLCIIFRSLEKNGNEQNVLLGLISRQKLEKRTETHRTFILRTEKNGTYPMEKNAVPNPELFQSCSNSSGQFMGHR